MFNIPIKMFGEVDFAEIIYQAKNDTDIYFLNKSYIPINLFPDIIYNIEHIDLPHVILKGKYPLVPVSSKSFIEIIYSDREDTQYLQIQEGQPLIKIDNILYSKNGQVVEYIVAKYRTDKCRFIFENYMD